MASQSNYYPCNETKDSLCIKCNAGLTSPDGTSGTNGPGATEGEDKSFKCEAYCNSACNINYCETSQAYCSISHELITSHGDVGSYPGSTTIKADDLINDHWTKDYWNSLIDKLKMAEIVGKYKSHGSAGSVTALIGNENFHTASLYNQVNTKLCNFNTKYNQVNVDDLITATIANAIGTAYNSAKFNASVCDVCNSTSAQAKKECICNCPKCSSCPTCATCPSCSCNCASCSCSNCQGCSCSNCQGCSCSAGPSTEGGT